jgi:hypothetical protein
MTTRSACALALLAALVLAVCTTALRGPARLKGRWRGSHGGLECKVHFFQGQDGGDGALRGYFSERAGDGYRGSGRYELRMAGASDGTITLHGHRLGTLVGTVHLGSRRMDLGPVVYFRQ